MESCHLANPYKRSSLLALSQPVCLCTFGLLLVQYATLGLHTSNTASALLDLCCSQSCMQRLKGIERMALFGKSANAEVCMQGEKIQGMDFA